MRIGQISSKINIETVIFQCRRPIKVEDDKKSLSAFI